MPRRNPAKVVRKEEAGMRNDLWPTGEGSLVWWRRDLDIKFSPTTALRFFLCVYRPPFLGVQAARRLHPTFSHHSHMTDD